MERRFGAFGQVQKGTAGFQQGGFGIHAQDATNGRRVIKRPARQTKEGVQNKGHIASGGRIDQIDTKIGKIPQNDDAFIENGVRMEIERHQGQQKGPHIVNVVQFIPFVPLVGEGMRLVTPCARVNIRRRPKKQGQDKGTPRPFVIVGFPALLDLIEEWLRHVGLLEYSSWC